MDGLFALHLPNVGSDLQVMDNIMENVLPGSLPVLAQLLAPQPARGCAGLVSTGMQQALDLGEEFINRHQCVDRVSLSLSPRR